MSEMDGIKMGSAERPETLEGPESRLDRLVDGELGETDRRDLLLQLEREPEGWRKCALAFLEAQCWRQELGQMARSPEAASVEFAPAAPPKVAARPAGAAASGIAWRQRLATLLSMGACFLIALVLGMSVRGWSGGSTHDPANSVVTTTTETVPLKAVTDAEQSGVAAWPGAGSELVTLDAVSPDGNCQTVSIPAVRRDTVDENMWLQVPDAIPPEVQRILEQTGHRVQQRRQIVPVPIDSGHRLMVPVNQVEIHYVGSGSL